MRTGVGHYTTGGNDDIHGNQSLHFLVIAVVYFLYLRQQPKIDKLRKMQEEMRERMARNKGIQAEKDARRAQKK